MLPQLQAWGVTIADPDVESKRIDRDGRGGLSSVEFHDWALQHRLDLEDDDD